MPAILRPLAFVLAAALLLLGAASHGARPSGETPEAAPTLAGKFLVAAARMRDPRFKGTVIYMVRHDATGAMGLVINRPLGRSPIAELLAGLEFDTDGVRGEIDVHYGGPVEPGVGFILHGPDYRGPHTVVVTARVSLTTDPEVLRAIGKGEGPARAHFALGYAGWVPGQLEGELAREDWVVAPPDADLIFDPDHENKWRRALENRGIEL